MSDDLVGWLAKRPDLVVRPAARHGPQYRVTVAVQAKNRAKERILEPAHDQLTEILRADIAAVETTNVTRPPGDAAHGHIQAGPHLRLQRLESRSDVSRPDD